MRDSSPAIHEKEGNFLLSMREGGGGHLKTFPPHLNPLPPEERKYFLCNSEYQNSKQNLFDHLEFWAYLEFVICDLEFGRWALCSMRSALCDFKVSHGTFQTEELSTDV